MNNKEFSQELEERTKNFAIDIINLSSKIHKTTESVVIKNQITKSATSIGANYREANRARSRADFKNKIKICESEASETKYWLEIISSMNWFESDKIRKYKKECSELLALFTSINNNLDNNKK